MSAIYFPPWRETVFCQIDSEREAQDAQWGEQNHPSVGEMREYGVFDEEVSKKFCEWATQEGNLTWGHIACEELAEALNAPNDTDRRAELIQLAAVIVAWCECIDRNNRK